MRSLDLRVSGPFKRVDVSRCRLAEKKSALHAGPPSPQIPTSVNYIDTWSKAPHFSDVVHRMLERTFQDIASDAFRVRRVTETTTSIRPRVHSALRIIRAVLVILQLLTWRESLGGVRNESPEREPELSEFTQQKPLRTELI